jgi:hypothetical protein
MIRTVLSEGIHHAEPVRFREIETWTTSPEEVFEFVQSAGFGPACPPQPSRRRNLSTAALAEEEA